ncbi:sensor histidine kinase [Paenibacillus luteus]|uniref:sensor histidine kinase n=1 Tax=Paenibacillus luteus TaxID=2545753 RepID=UPI001142E6F3|nr:HAMP domain-containing sensor histidine kinase [Paenibacillus luteus]
MSIRARLLLSYILMSFLPLILLAVTVYIVLNAFVGDFIGRYNLDFSHNNNPFKTILAQEKEVFTDMKLQASTNPDQLLLEPLLLEGWDSKLKEMNMAIVLLKNNQTVYASTSLDKAEVVKAFDHDEITGSFVDFFFISNGYTFQYNDLSEGSFYIVTDIGPLSEFIGKYFVISVLLLVFILLLTNGALTYFVFRSTVTPLKALRRAVDQIKQGNLEFAVNFKKDEIGGLFQAFEEMREQLKHSIGIQQQYEENRKELISNISHDLKTPIASIKGYVEGILDGVADNPDKMDKYIRTIYAKTKDMDRLINELFMLSKLDMGKIPFYFEKVDIIEFLEDCTEEMQFILNEKAITLTLELSTNEPVMITGDREKLKRAISNILDNAVKYMDKEWGTIRIRVDEESEWVKLLFEDNGQGMQQDELPYIFERFYRSDLSRNSETGGSGLGLAIVKQIIEEHGGEVQAASEIGVSTSITIRLRKVRGHE